MDPVVILATDHLTLSSGDTTQVGVRVLNRGRRVEAYRIDVVGEAAAFATVEPAVVSVLPGREEQVQLVFVAPTGPSARAGTHRFGVRAVSEVDPTSSALAEGRLELEGAGGVHAWLPVTAASGRWSTRYRLELDNRGNAAVRLAVAAHEPTGDVRLEVVPDVVELLPGAPTGVSIEARARRPFLRGTPVTRMVQVATHDFPFGAARPLPGAPVDPDDPHHHRFQLAFEQRPILAKWMLAAAALAVAALVLVALVVLRQGGGSGVELEVAEPFTPFEFEVTSLGSSKIALVWSAVPNAVSYEVWPSEPDGTTPADAQEQVVDDATTTIDGLAPSAEHCYKVRSVGFDDQTSDFTAPRCVETGAVAVIPVPAEVTAIATDPTTLQVEWSYPIDALEAVTGFTLIVDNKELPDRFVKTDGGRQQATIQIDASTSERVVGIRVRTETADGLSDASEVFEVPVPAVPVSTTPAVPPGTPVDDGTGGSGAGSATTVPGSGGGAATTTTSTTTTLPDPGTTTSPPLPSGTTLQLDPQFEETWAAMLPQITSSSASVDLLKRQLAAAAGSAPLAVRDFFNRDKVVTESVNPNVPEFQADFISGVASAIGALGPDQRWQYLTVVDGDAATAVCADLIARNPRCVSVRVRSAGHPSARILPIEQLARDTAVDEIDARLVELRAENPTLLIHLLDTTDWDDIAGNSWMLFALVTPDNEAQLCAAQDRCVTLNPSS